MNVNSVITVKHQGTNVHGTLQYPKFYRIRSDVQWKDLVAQENGAFDVS